METVTITLPDGSQKRFPRGVTLREIAETISPRLAREALVADVNGTLRDLSSRVEEDASVRFLTFDDPQGREVFWHSTAHLLAQAVLRLRPGAKLTIGPPIEEGFYYDIDTEPFTEEDLKRIEEEMQRIVKEDYEIIREEVTKEEARERFKENPYKLELLDEFPEGKVSIYRQGEFEDLCRGPHIPRTGLIKAFKLLRTSSAYWRGDPNKKQLQRVYGISFPKRKLLEEWLHQREEAEKRDHRKLGRMLDLFMLHELSPGSPFFTEKGTIIYNELVRLFREEYAKRGYIEVMTPILYRKELWETSGHWEAYKENMFTLTIDGQEYALKAMNCPAHVLLYKRRAWSYRDLPVRMAEFGIVHRNELSGVLSGLTRVRKFTQDDAHIFAREDQIFTEIKSLLDFVNHILREVFGFDYHVELSTRPEKYIGELSLWEKAEAALRQALEEAGMAYRINEGDGAFYGPKIDFHVQDSLKRSWQLSTIQLDFNMPRRFDATYYTEDGGKAYPVMIHRAILGSLERFMGILIEQYEGRFPVWLAPEQVRLIPVTRDAHAYAAALADTLREKGYRLMLDTREHTFNYRLREAREARIPLILIIGTREAEKHEVTVRVRDTQKTLPWEVFLAWLEEQRAKRKRDIILP